MWVIRLWFKPIALKKRVIRSENSHFSYVLTVFSLFKPKSESLMCSSLICSFLKRTWVIHSRRSLQKSDMSLITKERPWAIRSCHSFAGKKQAICSKNWWANSQPWENLTTRRRKNSKHQHLLLSNCIRPSGCTVNTTKSLLSYYMVRTHYKAKKNSPK